MGTRGRLGLIGAGAAAVVACSAVAPVALRTGASWESVPPCPARTAPAPEVAGPEPGLGAVWHRQGDYDLLARRDPLTLEPTGDGAARFPDALGEYAFSPGGGSLVASRGPVGPTGVRFLDAGTLSDRARLRLPAPGWIGGLSWPDKGSAIAAVQTPCCIQAMRIVVFWLDPARPTVVDEREFPGIGEGSHPYKDGLVLLSRPSVGSGIGPTRVTVAATGGRLRSVMLGRITTGWQAGEEGTASTDRSAALTVAGRSAFVYARGGPLAEVDLDALQVEYHPAPDEDRSGRSAGTWPVASAAAKSPAVGSYREIHAVDHHLMITGVNSVATSDPDQPQTEPAGLLLIDRRTWRGCRLLRGVAEIEVSDGVVLAHNSLGARPKDDAGLTAFTAAGARLWHRFGVRPVGGVTTSGPYVFVSPRGGRGAVHVIDLATGRTVARPRSYLPQWLVRGVPAAEE